jgi:hypothetical protein
MGEKTINKRIYLMSFLVLLFLMVGSVAAAEVQDNSTSTATPSSDNSVITTSSDNSAVTASATNDNKGNDQTKKRIIQC